MITINKEAVQQAMQSFLGAHPFDHCVVDSFFSDETARALELEFQDYEDKRWFYYKNPIEDKKAMNDWNIFPALTYKVFSYLNSKEFIAELESVIGQKLFADHGLHGGGWHMHATGGNLNPHLDYSIHPKLKLQRKLNIIIYLSEQLSPEHGGHLGLWEQDAVTADRPGKLIKEIAPKFNRAVIFDTTQNSWHGMSRALTQPASIFRKSLAVYYLCEPPEIVCQRGRALYAARESQLGDVEVERIIKLRSDVHHSMEVYRTE